MRIKRAIDWFPRGWELPERDWSQRHRGILVVLWLHAIGVPVFGIARGETVGHSLWESAGIIVFAAAATSTRLRRRWRMSAASMGLLTASAVLVHLSEGSIEMHFHFFVMVPLVALYQDWFPFLLAIAYVGVHHGAVGAIDPASVYNHAAALNSPWKWAGIHALFIGAQCVVLLTTWKVLEAALRDARSEARVKSEFLSIMSHEIRTPLTAVIGYAGLLESAELPEEERDYVKSIRRSGDHLLSLVNDLLDYSKLEAGKLELEEEPFDMLRVVDDAFAVVGERARAQGVRLSSLCEHSVPRTLVGDSGRISQVLLNLLSNAIKFSEDGEVFVRVVGHRLPGDDDRTQVALSVSDTGIGIEPDDFERLFIPFAQAERSTARRFGGTGLGLSIVQHLCQLMGGSITVSSEPGRGSTFTASFVAQAPSQDPTRPPIAPSPTSALVVCVGSPEDCLLLEYLSEWGIRTKVADALEAIQLARNGERWDVIFVRPPVGDLDVVAFARELRSAYDEQPHLALIAAEDESEFFDTRFGEPLRQSKLYDLLASLGDGDGLATYVAQVEEDGRGLAETYPMRILVADDNHANRRVIVARLARMGYEADEVSDGAEAIEATGSTSYDVVLMDVHMPNCDGITATRRIREREVTPQPAIIALTADSTTEVRDSCLEAGMDLYQTKPVRPTELAAALRRVASARDRARPGVAELG